MNISAEAEQLGDQGHIRSGQVDTDTIGVGQPERTAADSRAGDLDKVTVLVVSLPVSFTPVVEGA